MRKACKCILVFLAGWGVFAASAAAQFKNGSQPTELNIPRVSQRGTVDLGKDGALRQSVACGRQ
jgi:hypothetical protein